MSFARLKGEYSEIVNKGGSGDIKEKTGKD
jgi:hypothetical protein